MAVKEQLKNFETVAEQLLTQKLVTEDVLQSAIEEAIKTERSLLRLLVDSGALKEADRLRFLHKMLELPVVSLRDIMPRPEVSGFLSVDKCRRHRVVPLRIEAAKLLIAMEDPTDISALTAAETASEMDLKPVLASGADIDLAISRMPDLDSADAERPSTSPFIQKLVLLILTFVPSVAFYVAIFLSGKNGPAFTRELDEFGRVLFLLLTWGSWASIAYFITDIVFTQKPKR